MEQEKKQAVAPVRYSAIAPLITGTQEDYESLSAYFRIVSAKGIKAPDGSDVYKRQEKEFSFGIALIPSGKFLIHSLIASVLANCTAIFIVGSFATLSLTTSIPLTFRLLACLLYTSSFRTFSFPSRHRRPESP